MKEINIIRADLERLTYWEGIIKELEEDHGFRITVLESVKEGEILEKGEDRDVIVIYRETLDPEAEIGELKQAIRSEYPEIRDAIVIHCGSLGSTSNIKELVQTVRREYPNMKIGLETNLIHPLFNHPYLRGMVDFHIYKPDFIN